MARNYTMKEVVEIFVANKDQEAMADIGKRFPLLAIKVAGLVAKAPTEATDLFKFSPDYLSANKMNKAIKDSIVGVTSDEDEDDAEDVEEQVEAPKKAKKTVADKKTKATEKTEDGAYDFDNMNNAQMYKLLGEFGERKQCKAEFGSLSHDAMLSYLKKHHGDGVVEEEEEAEDDAWEDADEADTPVDPYEGKAAPELFKECKKRGIKAAPKKPAKFYADLLRKADAEAAEADDADDDDEWEEVDVEEERKAADKAAKAEKAEKAPKATKAAKKPGRPKKVKEEPVEDEDDEWDI